MLTNEEIIRGAYAAGKKRITCPVCNGGDSREEDTMSLWAGESGLLGHCYRATCRAKVRSDALQVLPTAPFKFEPRPLRAPYRLVNHDDAWGKEWCRRLEQDGYFFGVDKMVHARGFRVLAESPDTAVWRLRALDGTLTGHITRTLDKKISTYKDLDRSLYYWNGLNNNKALFVFEDAMSAALCSFPAIALLGTSISDGLIKDIKEWAVPDGVLVCLDPGAEDAALKVYTRLVNAGVPAVFVPMAKDFKDMTLEERKILEETYA